MRASEVTVTIGKAWSDDGKYYARTSKGKVTKTVLPFKEGQKIIVDRKLISGRTFWRIKGSNKYIFGPDIKTFPLQSLRY